MDFQSLNRRELQALCKLNKIPANITNVAMADALRSLEFVEGIQEYMKPSQSETAESCVESPEKTEVTSPMAPHTGYRTSTRLRQKKEEAGTLTRTTRRGTRTQIVGDVQETPAVSSSRRRAAIATSARRNVEKQLNESEEDLKNEVLIDQEKKRVLDMPVAIPNSTRRSARLTEKKVFSTRRSVRLTEKKSAEPSVMERKIIKPIKIDSLSDDLIEVSEATSGSGISSLKISHEGLESTHDFEVSSERTKDDVEEENVDHCELDNSKAKFEGMSKAFEDGNLEDKLNSGEENVVPSEVDNSKEKSDNVSNTFEEPDVALVPDEHSNKLVIEKDGDLEDKLQDGEEKVDLCESEISKAQAEEFSKASEELVAVSDSKEHSEWFLGEKNGDLEDKINDDENDDGDLDTKTEMVYVTEDAFDLLSGEKLGADNIPVNAENRDLLKSENGYIFSDVKGSSEDTLAEETIHQVLENKVDVFLPDIESPSEQEVSMEFEGLAASVPSGNVLKDSVDFPVTLQSTVPQETNETGIEDDVMSGDLAKTESDVFTFDMNYMKDQEIMNYPDLHAVQDLDVGFSDEELPTDNVTMDCGETNEDNVNGKMSGVDFADAATDEVKPVVEFYSGISITKEPGIVDTWSIEEGNEFPLNLVTSGVDHPTHLTPLKKASTKTPTTVRRMALVSDDKENIDRSGIKLHLTTTKDEGKKSKKEKAEDNRLKILNETSLRQLRKMLQNLQIKDKVNTANEDITKAVKTPRPALQVLPDNHLVTGEMEN